MKGKSTKLRILSWILVAAMTVTMAFSLAACKNNDDTPTDGSSEPNPSETTTHKVSVIGLKTQTINVKDGETLEQYLSDINLTPQKSGEKFVGWYEDGAETPYDWSAPITKDITIRARFEKIEGHSIKNGTAFPTDDGGLVTGSANTLFTYGSFEKGSFTVDVTPTKEGNDCGVLFGAEESVSGTWEDFSYYTLLINKDGVMLLASIPWSEVIPGVALSDVGIAYDINTTYTVTVKYSGNEDRYLECYVNGTLVMSTTLDKGFYGNGVGCRAAVDGTVFGEMTFDGNDIPERPSNDVGNGAVRNGSVEENDFGYKTTAGSTLFIMNDVAFNGGSIEATIRPNTPNDCALIFGADVTSGAAWENFDYFVAMINFNGTILFAKVNPWSVMASSPILEEGFDPTQEYTLKVLYTDGYARIYAKGGSVKDYKLAATVYIGELKGTSVGFRAAAENTEFSKTLTINENDNLTIPNAATNIEFTDKRVGSVEKGGNGVYTTTGNDTNDFLTLSSTTLSAGGRISVKMTRADGDTGVIFGFTGEEDWEGSNTYYMLFIDVNGSVRAASFPWEQWAEVFGAVAAAEEHTLTISYDGNGVVCFVDGTMYAAFDNVKLNGELFGIRGKGGATYSDWSVVDYSKITDNT